MASVERLHADGTRPVRRGAALEHYLVSQLDPCRHN
jgi:hypothetical protein